MGVHVTANFAVAETVEDSVLFQSRGKTTGASFACCGCRLCCLWTKFRPTTAPNTKLWCKHGLKRFTVRYTVLLLMFGVQNCGEHLLL